MLRYLTALLGILACGTLVAENGVSPTEIKIGMSNALTGPAGALGTGVKEGAMVYIDMINEKGGVHGRKIKLVSYDDGYEPKKTIENTKKLISEDKVFLLFGYVGTPTSKAVVPLVSRNKVPYVGPYTGAEFLRAPLNKNIFNVRGSYFNETERIVNSLVDDMGIKDIGIFVQDDGYGNAGKAGVVRALRKKGLSLKGEGRYKRNTVDIDEGLNKLLAAKPKAVILVGAYKPCAAFIKKAKEKNLNAVFSNISFVGTKNLIGEMGAAGEGTYISQVMPSPTDESIAIVKEYNDAIKAKGLTPSYTSLEGYVAAKVLVQGLEQAGKDLSRDSFKQGMYKVDLKMGDAELHYSAKSHVGFKSIFLTKVKDGKAVPVEKF